MELSRLLGVSRSRCQDVLVLAGAKSFGRSPTDFLLCLPGVLRDMS